MVYDRCPSCDQALELGEGLTLCERCGAGQGCHACMPMGVCDACENSLGRNKLGQDIKGTWI